MAGGATSMLDRKDHMHYRLEVVVVPVSDVDRAKAFYTDKAGFHLDHDAEPSEQMRVVQLTPPGSACSIVIGSGLSDTPPGSAKGLQLVVADIEAARAELAGRGVEVSEIREMGRPGRPGFKFVFFSDPDGNGWAVQELAPAATSGVTGVDFVTIPTRDFAAAERFYGEVLGLPCSARYDRIPGAEFETGSLTLQVIDVAAIGREFAAHAFPIALHVDDVAVRRAELESRGVEFIHAFDSGVCHNAFFQDPDGNAFLLHHRYAPKGAA
jgi:catechol 2,3-dioxygenase-like lactoylglutathione lyase family enzyme